MAYNVSYGEAQVLQNDLAGYMLDLGEQSRALTDAIGRLEALSSFRGAAADSIKAYFASRKTLVDAMLLLCRQLSCVFAVDYVKLFGEAPVSETDPDAQWPSAVMKQTEGRIDAILDGDLADAEAAVRRALEAAPSETFAWDESSTYIRRPPYFDGMTADLPEPAAIEGARALVRLGDFVTTDHISPAGPIAADSPAARYLRERGVGDDDFNTYGSRRGNHEVMERGTFANVKLRNALAGGRIGCWTLDQLSGELASVWDAAVGYGERGVPLVVVAGQMYGSGSSRDWAAKGPMLQGVRAVLASSFERIHRSNLVGMGILPLQFAEGNDADSLGLDGTEVYSIPAVDLTSCELPATVTVRAVSADGAVREFPAVVRVDTPTEAVYIAHGGILPFMVRKMAARG